jgi:hypothetical protein
MEIQANDPTPEDLEMMRALRSSTPEWRGRIVQILQNAARGSVWRRLVGVCADALPEVPRWAMASVAVLIAASSAGWWTYSQNPSRKSDRLLAEAYTANRQFEWRLPDAGWAHKARASAVPHGSGLLLCWKQRL